MFQWLYNAITLKICQILPTIKHIHVGLTVVEQIAKIDWLFNGTPTQNFPVITVPIKTRGLSADKMKPSPKIVKGYE